MLKRLIFSLAALIAATAFAPAAAPAAEPGELFPVNSIEMPKGAIPSAPSGVRNNASETPDVSANGRYTVFISQAESLDPASNPNVVNVYRKDRITGEVILVSRASGANGAGAKRDSFLPKISADGNLVAFMTDASLALTDVNGTYDIYVRDIAANTTRLVTPGLNIAPLQEYDLSADGQYIAFVTSQKLVPADGNNGLDVYRRKINGGGTYVLVSFNHAKSAASGGSRNPSISGDGRWVAFESTAQNLVNPFTDGNGANDSDVYVRDMEGAGKTYLVSANAADGTKGGNRWSEDPLIAGTPGGTLNSVFVAYTSSATDVDADGVDASPTDSVYRRQLNTTSSKLISRGPGNNGTNADGISLATGISDDGNRIVFYSWAKNLGVTATGVGMYVREVQQGNTRLFSDNSSNARRGAIAGNGRYAVWLSEDNPTGDGEKGVSSVYGRSLDPATVLTMGGYEHLSRPPGSAPWIPPVASLPGASQKWSIGPVQWNGARQISADGRYVVFVSHGPRLPSSTPDVTRIYRRDLRTGETIIVSRHDGADGSPIGQSAGTPSISADGNRVAFGTEAALDPADTDSENDIYVRDIAAGRTILASRADGPAGVDADKDAINPRISANGNRVTFQSRSDNLGAPVGNEFHIFLRDIDAGRTFVVDRASAPDTSVGDGDATESVLSADGRYVAFTSKATNLSPDDLTNDSDIYLRDVLEEKTILLSRRNGLGGQPLTGGVYLQDITDDGRYVVLLTADDQAVPGAGPFAGVHQVVRREVSTGANVLVSVNSGGQPSNATTGRASISADGNRVAFTSAATNLIPGLGGLFRSAAFIRDLGTGTTTGAPAFGLVNNFQGVSQTTLSNDGRCLLIQAEGHNQYTGPAGDWQSAYVYVVEGDCHHPEPLAGGAVKPRLSNVTLKPRKFAVAKKPTAKVAAAKKGRKGKKRVPKGTTFRFRLNTTANVRIAIQRRATGIKVKAKGKAGKVTCRKASARALRRVKTKQRCVLWRPVGALVRRNRAGGVLHKVAFTGRIGRKALAPGSYRAVLRASNTAGTSPAVNRPFQIVRG